MVTVEGCDGSTLCRKDMLSDNKTLLWNLQAKEWNRDAKVCFIYPSGSFVGVLC
jgi:hypothetical protein